MHYLGFVPPEGISPRLSARETPSGFSFFHSMYGAAPPTTPGSNIMIMYSYQYAVQPAIEKSCAPRGIRTPDRLVKSQLLYQLSYKGIG